MSAPHPAYDCRFVEVANRLREVRQMDYKLQVEGEIFESLTAVVDCDLDTSRVTFQQVRSIAHAQMHTPSPTRTDTSSLLSDSSTSSTQCCPPSSSTTTA